MALIIIIKLGSIRSIKMKVNVTPRRTHTHHKENGLFPSGKEQSGLPLGNNVFAVGVAERAEGFKTSWRIDGVE